MIRNLLFVVMVAAMVFAGGCKEKDNEVDVKTKAPQVDKKAAATPQDTDSVLVKLSTTLGDIVLRLDEEKAPVTVANFLQYVNDGFYDGLIFHRIMPGFMIQAGGFDKDLNKQTPRKSIINEGNNGLNNKRGTIAMARQNAINSATCQFFINHKDNANLDSPAPDRLGYAVFGKVVEGIDIVDAIAAAKQKPATAKNGQSLINCPAENIIIISAKKI